MVKAFVFDLDGVITETAKLHYKAWKEEVSKIGINFTKEENATLKGLPRVETLIGILKIHNKLNEVSKNKIQEMAQRKNKRYLELLEEDMTKKDILPGVKKFLDDAKKHNIKMVIASSSLNAPKILKKIDLFDYFMDIVNPNDIKEGKPSPDIYLKACELAGVQPSEVIGFEDAMAGVEGLVAAKIKTVAITWKDQGNWDIANLVIDSTKDLDFGKIMNL